MCEFLKNNNKYIFLKKKKRILTPNGNFLSTNSLSNAKKIMQEINVEKFFNDPYSVLNLTLFACDLRDKERKMIIQNVIELIQFDFILYRCFDEKKLLQLLNKNFNDLIQSFSNIFKIDLILISEITERQHNLNLKLFNDYLIDLNDSYLTVIYKLSNVLKSVILSYFFLEGKLDYGELYKLANIENTYQQKKWGLIDEQKIVDKEFLMMLKNISIFFKNLD